MSLNVLETDAHGRVVEKPVVEWTVTTDRAVTVVAAFEYRDTASHAKKEWGKIQFGLTPQQALELARALTEIANDVLQASSQT